MLQTFLNKGIYKFIANQFFLRKASWESNEKGEEKKDRKIDKQIGRQTGKAENESYLDAKVLICECCETFGEEKIT